jgi:hypothetical protein
MSRPLSNPEARAFRKRWQLVNARELDEVRSASMELRWQQFKTLLAWAQEFGWSEVLRDEEDQVRQRWARLRKASRG